MTPEDKKRTTDTLKELRHAFKCDTLAELGEVLGIQEHTIRNWSCIGIAQDKEGLLEIILRQKKKLNLLEDGTMELKLKFDVSSPVREAEKEEK